MTNRKVEGGGSIVAGCLLSVIIDLVKQIK